MIGKIATSCFVSVALMVAPFAPLLQAQESSGPQMSPVPDGSVQYQLYTEKMDLTVKFTRELRAALDRTTFDLDALLESLDYDATSIIGFVKEQIAFEQYPGVLRGAKGTLFSRAGNSIDQALLLARLLRDAGYDARIVGAKLDKGSALTVLKAMRQPARSAPPFGDVDAILDVLERYGLVEDSLSDETRAAFADYVRAAPKATDLMPYPSVAATSEFVRDQLDGAGVKSGESTDLVTEARQYYWVQFKDAASDPWASVHPIFADAVQFSPPDASSFFLDAIPEDLQHKFRLQVFIERKVGDRLEVLPVTSPWERPVANLIGEPLTFSNLSDSMMSTDASGKDPSELLVAANFFAPTFGHASATGERFFDLHGNLIDPMVAGSSASGLFATVNSAFGDAIGNIGKESSIPTLTAQWIEYTLISPNGTEEVFRRTTFDRIGAAARAKGVLPTDFQQTENADVRSLIQLHTIMMSVGAIPRGFILESTLDSFESARGGYDTLIGRHYGAIGGATTTSELPESWAKFLPLLSFFDLARTAVESHKQYRAGPALYVHSIGLDQGDGYVESMDVVSNPWRAINKSDDVPRIDAKAVIQAGVWETAVEGALLSGTFGSESFDTWRAFSVAEENGIEPVVLVPGAKNPEVVLPANVRAAIDSDLEKGFAVIVPRKLSSIGEAGWWRVDVETGDTVGRIRDGRGGAIAEKLTTLGIVFSGVLLRLSTVSCARDASSIGSAACCHFGNSLVTALTFGFGSLFSLTRTGSAAIGLYGSVAIDTYAYNIPIGELCEDAFTPDPPPMSGWTSSPHSQQPIN